MARLAIAMDLGTSGFRAQAIDLGNGEILSTVITTRHPLPGGNVMSQLNFVLNRGMEVARSKMIRAINRVIAELHVPPADVVRLGVCGNPNQLSLFQGIEIRDLAFAGSRKLALLGVVPPARDGAVVAAHTLDGLNLPGGCEVVIPPAVRQEVGADALAMMIMTGMLERQETSIVTDFGTNAEVALFHGGTVYSGSTAAGPALEGQQISCGRLAAPWVIADLEPVGPYHRLILLDEELLPVRGGLIDLCRKGFILEADQRHAMHRRPIGITGTGTIAIVDQATQAGLIALPHVETEDARLHLGEDIFFTREDLCEAGKAIGAVRAGHITLCHEAGITPEDIHTIYMSGASGTYVDAAKAQRVGLIPPRLKKVYQVGNTSLAMARNLATNPRALDRMIDLANRLRVNHCMFATSKIFQKVYILELSYWTEGMPMHHYRRFLKKFGLADLPPVQGPPEVVRTVKRDIDDLGRRGLTTLEDFDSR